MAEAIKFQANVRDELDDVTLARARRGDEAACRSLVLRYQRPVFALLSRFLCSATDGDLEDLAQETFLRVFRGLGGFRVGPEARFSTWILTIATRIAIDEQRRRRRSPPRVYMLESRGASEPGPDARVERQLLGEALRRAAEELSDEQRAVFILRVYHDLDYREIAEALDCDIGTVKSRLSRAKARLRRALNGGSDG